MKYLLTVFPQDKNIWKKFAKNYKQKGLGNNLDEAIIAVIKKENLKK